ncbi:ABC transporter permease [Bacillus sp. M6-12]|uniref:ABC transporter permease n=1 Tax=Bacillus sp. M6-12 TaxID=2054166 RepID=UPI000C77BF83|nr:ABC transporter permease [Bacillus sp. M6-12]PLS18652.1 ABC transporter permease [Bacillus sp. M6-12]
MDGDGLVWVIIFMMLFIINAAAIYLYKNNKMHFIWSGFIISIIGPFLAFLVGGMFVKMSHNAGGTGEGGALAGAFIGLIIVGNGILYFFIGLALKVSSFIKKRKV